MKKTLEMIFAQIWPMILVCSIILVVLRITYLFKKRQKFVFHHELFMFIFILYMMCLFYVVTFQDIDTKGVTGYNLIPFREMFRYKIGSRLFFKNVIGNLLMFIPFGFFTTYILYKIKFRWVLIITLIVSLSIELIQTQIGRVFDIDDVFLNVLGGTLGFLFFSISYKLFRE